MQTCKADNKGRVRIPKVEPGQVFACENPGEGQFLLTILKKAEPEPPREVKLVKGANGLYQWPADARPTRAELLAAIRADKETQ